MQVPKNAFQTHVVSAMVLIVTIAFFLCTACGSPPKAQVEAYVPDPLPEKLAPIDTHQKEVKASVLSATDHVVNADKAIQQTPPATQPAHAELQKAKADLTNAATKSDASQTALAAAQQAAVAREAYTKLLDDKYAQAQNQIAERDAEIEKMKDEERKAFSTELRNWGTALIVFGVLLGAAAAVECFYLGNLKFAICCACAGAFLIGGGIALNFIAQYWPWILGADALIGIGVVLYFYFNKTSAEASLQNTTAAVESLVAAIAGHAGPVAESVMGSAEAAAGDAYKAVAKVIDKAKVDLGITPASDPVSAATKVATVIVTATNATTKPSGQV